MIAALTKRESVNPSLYAGTPRVSVIVIFLNEERFIEEAVQSVFAQSFTNWELLLVDDGSTDGSTRIATQYARDNPDRVVYLEHAGHCNRGMSASRNLGINNSKGDFIAFLDADDVWLPEKLEQQVRILDIQPDAGMVYGATEYWSSWTGQPEDQNRDFKADLAVTPDSLVQPPELLPVLLRNQIVTTTGALARRKVIEQIGGFEESFRGLHEDQVFYAKMVLNSPVYVSDKCWYRYRRHSDSCCAITEKSGHHYAERRTFLKWLDSYLEKTGLGDKQVRRQLRKARFEADYPALNEVWRHLLYSARINSERIKRAVRNRLPRSVYRWLRKIKHGDFYRPTKGDVDFGDLRHTSPLSRVFGFDRGQPVDRYYIEKFLENNAENIRGSVMEIGDDSYTKRFGGDRVLHVDVLSVKENNPRATIIADLADASHIPADQYNCIILTQTLHLIYDIKAALATLHRILKPGGVLLVTVPGISQIDHHEWRDSWYWSFTRLSAQKLFGEVFGRDNVQIKTWGNVLSATAFLQGLASDELTKNELEAEDADYQVTIAIQAYRDDAPGLPGRDSRSFLENEKLLPHDAPGLPGRVSRSSLENEKLLPPDAPGLSGRVSRSSLENETVAQHDAPGLPGRDSRLAPEQPARDS